MPNLLDIELLPLYRRFGQDQAVLPGLVLARKPRRAARSRESDQLIIYLALAGNATLPLDLPDQLLNELAKTFYEASGSATAALRQTAEQLNKFLLKRNVQSPGSQQTIGLLTLVAVRGDQLYLAQSGPVYAMRLAANEMQELYDPALSGRGLGVSQSTPLRYYHANLGAGDVLLLAMQPPSAWNAAVLSGLYGQNLESQQRALLNQVSDVNAVLLNARPGQGRVNLLAARPVLAASGEPKEAPGLAGMQSSPATPPGEEGEDLARTQAMLDQYQPLPEWRGAGEPSANQGLEAGFATPGFPDSAAVSVSVASRAGTPQPPTRLPEPVTTQKPATGGGQATGDSQRARSTRSAFFKQVGLAIHAGLNRILPEEALAAIPNSVLAFMALAVPLVIVAMATAVYFQRGLAAQSQLAYDQAVAAVAQAQVQADPAQRRAGMQTALGYLTAANTVRALPEVQELHAQILAELDELDLVRRVDYQTAIIGGLPEGVTINRIVTADTDLYLLDSQNGKVLRAFFTNLGYQLDPTFQCGPGSPANVGTLIDLSAWPIGSAPAASVVAMDAQGMLLFCSPGSAPQPKRLPNPPGGELAGLQGFTLDGSDLYVLDPAANSVWVYYNADFEGEPAYYFSEEPPVLQDVLDLAATNEELYLLHADGHTTLCVTGQFTEVTPTRCTDPASYVDMRAGMAGGDLGKPAYTQLQYSPPPDPSLYYLEPAVHAVDRFSLRNLTYQSRYLPAQPLDGASTAAWVDPIERLIFLAAGNRVYYANLP